MVTIFYHFINKTRILKKLFGNRDRSNNFVVIEVAKFQNYLSLILYYFFFRKNPIVLAGPLKKEGKNYLQGFELTLLYASSKLHLSR